jgi:hypothetical protein
MYIYISLPLMSQRNPVEVSSSYFFVVAVA